MMSCFTKKELNNPKFPMLTCEVNRLKHTEGGAGVVCEVMEKYEEMAEVNLLFRLVEKGKLNISDAAKEASLTDEEFLTQMEAAGYRVPVLV